MVSDAVITSAIEIIPSIFGGIVTIALFWIGRKLETVHTLVNSQMGVQLKLNAANSRWRADMSRKEVDIQAAYEAEALLIEHERNQAKADLTDMKDF